MLTRVIKIVFALLSADELEVEALFERELGKMYNEDNPEDDMVEKVWTNINVCRDIIPGSRKWTRRKLPVLAAFLCRRKSATVCASTSSAKSTRTKTT